MTPWNPTFFNKTIPKECQDKISGFQQEGHRILCIAFPAEGGNRWSIITNKGFFNRGIPGECHAKMQEFHKIGNRVISVSFPPAGGTRYTIITRNGGFFNRNSPGGYHRVVRAMNNSDVGQLAKVGFHPSGAYMIVSDTGPAGKPQPALTSNGKTFSIDDYAANLKAELDGKTCKYGFMVRYQSAMRAWADGSKRTADNPPEQRFSVFHCFNPASVTKIITAVALLHVIHKKGLTIEEKSTNGYLKHRAFRILPKPSKQKNCFTTRAGFVPAC